MAVKIQIRRDSAANWTSANPTLSSGEIALETDTKNVKIGDGTTAWTSLGYEDTGAKGLQAILTTQGDIVYASSANTPARLAIGTEGQVLTMGASVPEWADASGVGYNYIIDGNFQIAQLNPVVGTTVTNPASGTYPVFDMWKTAQSADGGTLPTIVHSQKAIYNDGIAGSTYCYNINVNGAGTSLGVNSYMTLNHYIENGTKMLAGTGNTVTLSFYGRSTIANKKIGFELVQTYGSGGSPSSSEQINGTSTITLTSTRTRYELTFTLNTLAGKTLGTNKDDNIVVEMWTMWGSNLASRVGGSGAETFVGAGDIEISQIKLEAGDTATDFVPEPYFEALRKCQRYLPLLLPAGAKSRVNGCAATGYPILYSSKISPPARATGTAFIGNLSTGAVIPIASVAKGTHWAIQREDGSLTDDTSTWSEWSVYFARQEAGGNHVSFRANSAGSATDASFYIKNGYALFLDARF